MQPSITHEPEAHRYLLSLTEAADSAPRIIGELEYVDAMRDGKRYRVFTHTGVRPEFRGRDYASLLVETAMQDLAGTDISAVARCPYVRSWLDEHPEVAEQVQANATTPPEA